MNRGSVGSIHRRCSK